jgi:hypothetical protein
MASPEGKCPYIEHTPQRQRQEQREEPLPHVWDVLERKVTLLSLGGKGNLDYASPRWKASKIQLRMIAETEEQEALLWDKGSDYDKAVLDFYTAVTTPRAGIRPITPEQFRQLRSDFEELSAEKIAKEKRQLLQEMQQLREHAFGLQFPPESSPSDTP